MGVVHYCILEAYIELWSTVTDTDKAQSEKKKNQWSEKTTQHTKFDVKISLKSERVKS